MQGDQIQSINTWSAPPDLVARRIRGELLLVPIRRSSNELDGFFTLNPIAADIWKWAGEGIPFSGLIDRMIAVYDVSRDEAERDAARAIEELERAGLLVKRIDPT